MAHHAGATTTSSEPLLGDAPSASHDHWTRRVARGAYASFTQFACAAFFGLIASWGLKTLGQSIAIALVLLFVAIQVLAYYGYAQVNWGTTGRRVGGALRNRLDVNHDGKVDASDVKAVCSSFISFVLSWGLLSVGGFALGFYLGARL